MEDRGYVSVRIRVVPGSSKDSIRVMEDGVLKVRVKATPEDGKANEAIRSLFSRILGHPRNGIQITRGEFSRNKTLRVEGLSLQRFQDLTEKTIEEGSHV